jgi:uncharacterized protein (DUF488 family)
LALDEASGPATVSHQLTNRIDLLLTIGIYGYSARTFMDALVRAEADAVIDIRARRGLRGSVFAWGNSRRLQGLVADAGITYLHLPEFAPTASIRDIQKAADHERAEAKRKRSELSRAFADAYEHEILRSDASARLLAAIPDRVVRPALLCVERLPEACHRSLLASRVHSDLGTPVQDLMP